MEAPSAEGLIVPARGSAVAVDGEVGTRRLRRGLPGPGAFELGALGTLPVYAEPAAEADTVVGLRDLAVELDGDAWQAASLGDAARRLRAHDALLRCLRNRA